MNGGEIFVIKYDRVHLILHALKSTFQSITNVKQSMPSKPKMLNSNELLQIAVSTISANIWYQKFKSIVLEE